MGSERKRETETETERNSAYNCQRINVKLENDVTIRHVIGNYHHTHTHILRILQTKRSKQRIWNVKKITFCQTLFALQIDSLLVSRIKFVGILPCASVNNIKMHLCCKFSVYYAMFIRFCLVGCFFLRLLFLYACIYLQNNSQCNRNKTLFNLVGFCGM